MFNTKSIVFFSFLLITFFKGFLYSKNYFDIKTKTLYLENIYYKGEKLNLEFSFYNNFFYLNNYSIDNDNNSIEGIVFNDLRIDIFNIFVENLIFNASLKYIKDLQWKISKIEQIEYQKIRSLDKSYKWYIQLLKDKEHPIRIYPNIKVYDIDVFENTKETIKNLKTSGHIVICYFSAGTYENFRKDRWMYPINDIGNQLEEWKNEYWINIKSEKIKNIIRKRIELAKDKGCDGIDPDNVDVFLNNSGFDISYEDQLEFNIFISQYAHKLGLLVGLKNDVEQIKDLYQYFDFAINEQCHENNECGYYLFFSNQNKPVINIEYELKNYYKYCSDNNIEIQTIFLPYELDGKFVKFCQ